jgi:hypothetical protein
MTTTNVIQKKKFHTNSTNSKMGRKGRMARLSKSKDTQILTIVHQNCPSVILSFVADDNSSSNGLVWQGANSLM